MNRQELESALQEMTSEAFATFVKDFGGEAKSPDEIVRGYIDHPEWEPRLCQLLGSPTEEERRTQATLRSATSARWSALASAISALVALVALLLVTLDKVP